MDHIYKIKNNKGIISIFFYRKTATNFELVAKNKHFFEECGFDGQIKQRRKIFRKYYYIELFPLSSKNFIEFYDGISSKINF